MFNFIDKIILHGNTTSDHIPLFKILTIHEPPHDEDSHCTKTYELGKIKNLTLSP